MNPFLQLLCAWLVYALAVVLKVLPTPIGSLVWSMVVVLLEAGLVLNAVREAWRDRHTVINIWSRLWMDVLASWYRICQLWEADHMLQGDQELRQGRLESGQGRPKAVRRPGETRRDTYRRRPLSRPDSTCRRAVTGPAGSSGAAAAEANATKQAGSSVFNADAAAFVPRWLRHAQESELLQTPSANPLSDLLETTSVPPLPDLCNPSSYSSGTPTYSFKAPTIANSSNSIETIPKKLLYNKPSSEVNMGSSPSSSGASGGSSTTSGGSSTTSGGSSGCQHSSINRGSFNTKGVARGRAAPLNQPSFLAAPAVGQGRMFTMPWNHSAAEAPHHFGPYFGGAPAFGGPPPPPTDPSPVALARQRATPPTLNPTPTSSNSRTITSPVPYAGPGLSQRAHLSSSMPLGVAMPPLEMYAQQGGLGCGYGMGYNTGFVPAWGQGYAMAHPAFGRPAGGFRV